MGKREIKRCKIKDDFIHLKGEISLHGSLHHLKRTDVKKYKSKIGLSTADGREFVILDSELWRTELWKHLWDCVSIKGVVDFYNKTVKVQSFYPKDAAYGVICTAFDSEYDIKEMLHFVSVV